MSKQFAIGIFHPKRGENVGTLWRTAFIMGASFIFTIGKTRYKTQATDTTKTAYQIPCFNFETFEEFEKNRPQNMQIVCVENSANAVGLKEFEHPSQCCYLLGAEDHGLPESITNKYPAVVIESARGICLNVHVAGSIISYDRVTKKIKN